MSRLKVILLLSVSLLLPLAADAQTPVPIRWRFTRVEEPPPAHARYVQWVINNSWQVRCDIDPAQPQAFGTLRWNSHRPGLVCEMASSTASWNWNLQSTYTFTMEAQAVEGEPYTLPSDAGFVVPNWNLPLRPSGLRVSPIIEAQ